MCRAGNRASRTRGEGGRRLSPPFIVRYPRREVPLPSNELPAHGEDRSWPWLAGVRSYGARVAQSARRLAEKPVVVGHSMGGFAITEAAAAEPDAFAGLVYLCAFAPLPGDTLLGLGLRDPNTLIRGNLRPALAGIGIRSDRTREVFYGACSEADAAWATARLRPDPVPPLLQRLRRSPPAHLPRAYVACSADRAISIERQRAMAERAEIPRVVTMNTDHSPFLSAPQELARHLAELVSVDEARR